MARYFDNEDGLPWELWENVVSRVLIGKHGQQVLAELEEALLQMPDRRLTDQALARDGMVCTVGLFIAKKRAEKEGVGLAEAIRRMQPSDTYSEAGMWETVEEASKVGMSVNLAWHLAFLNDDEWEACAAEERYEKLLQFVRRAQGKPEEANVAAD